MKKVMYKIGRFASVLFLFAMAQKATAQVGVGTTTPDPSAQLHIESTTKGLLIPRVTSTSAVTSPATGLMVYQTGGSPGFYYNSGTAIAPVWLRISDANTATSGTAGGDLTGSFPNPTIANNSVTAAKIADNTIANAEIATNAAIAYSKLDLNNSITNQDMTPNAITTSKISNGQITTTKMSDSAITGLKLATNAVGNVHIANNTLLPAKLSTTGATTGQALTYNGTSAVWSTNGAAVVWSTLSAAPSGTANGDLTGTYPNPTVANNAITSAKILDGTIANADIAPNAITTSKIVDGTVNTSKMVDSAISGVKILTNAVNNAHIADGVLNPAKLNASGATTGQALTYNGAAVVWSTLSAAPSGTASGDLTGTYPNPTVANNAITSAKILDGTIANADIAPNAITTSKIVDGTVNTSKMVDSAISGVKILTNAVNNAHIANGTLLPAKLSASGATSGQTLTYNGSAIVWSAPTAAPSGAAGGSLSGTYPNPTIATGSIDSSEIADSSITGTDISPTAAIAYSKLKLTNSITNADIVTAAAIPYSKLSLTNSITNADITQNAITTSRVANGTVTTAKMADSAISSLKILTNAVNNAHIANGTILPIKMSGNGATSGQVITYNGSDVVWATPSGGATPVYCFAGSSVTSYSGVGSTVSLKLPSFQKLSGVTANGTGTLFTVATAGTYRIEYNVHFYQPITVSGRVSINGTGDVSSSITPTTSGTADYLHAFTIVTLTAGTTVELQIFDSPSSFVTQNAQLIIQKLQ
jgi:hypothetical protein